MLSSAEVINLNDLYVFIELEIPANMTVEDFNSEDWHPITEGSPVYYHGDSNSLVPLGSAKSSVPILNEVTLDINAKCGETYHFNIIGHAIQSDNLPLTLSPEEVYELITGTD